MLGLFTEEEMETKEERDARLNKQELEEVSATFWMFPVMYIFEVLSKHKNLSQTPSLYYQRSFIS